MSLTGFTLKYRAIVIALVGVALAVGVMRFRTMPRRADPAFTISTCQVTTSWPGVEAKRVEELVTDPLEEEINRLPEVDVVRSTTTTGLSVIYVDLLDSVSPTEIPQIWDRVRAKVDIVRPTLPQGTMDPVVNDDFGDTAVMLLAVYEKPSAGESAAYSPRQLEIVAERIQERIGLLPGVSRADIHGVQQEIVYLETTGSNWANIDLKISDLEDLLQARNIVAPGGSIDTERSRYGIQPTGSFGAVGQIESLVVKRSPSGAPIYLRDVGIEVRRGYEDPPRLLTRYGEPDQEAPCVVVSFTMKDGYKVTDLGEQVRALLADLRDRDKIVPSDVAVEVVFDESTFVDAKILDFTVNILEAVLIVVTVAFLLAGLRSALVMAAAIPFVMAIAIGISSFCGVELEQMSIASLIIALGMLVDNAVVVCDNVRRYQRDGYGRIEAVVRGVERIQYPILMGTLTTVFAFAPLAVFLPGQKGEYMYSIPTVVSITLLTSWVLALTITSLMAYWIVRPREDGEAERAPIVWLAEKLGGKRDGASGPTIADRYGSTVSAFLKVKPLVLGVTVAVLAGTVLLPVGTQFFPDDKRDYLYIDVWLPEGTSLSATEKATRQVEKLLRDVSPVESEVFTGERLDRFYTTVGGAGPRFSLGVDPQPPQSNYSQLIVKTSDPLVTDDYIRAIRETAAKTIAGARVIPRKLALGPPVDAPIGLRIFGSGFVRPGFADEAGLRREARRVEDLLRGTAGLWDVHDVWGDSGYQLDIEIDEDRANLAGVSNASIAKTFNAYFTGHRVTTFREGDHQIPVVFRLPPAERGEIRDPRGIFVEGTSGKVPIDLVASLSPARKTAKIERRERNRMIEVRGRVEEGVLASSKLAEVLPRLRELESSFPHGMSIELGGEHENVSETQGQMGAAFLAAIVLIILCLIIQYNSLIKPVVILMTVPMGLVGAMFGLWATGNALGFMPMLGMVSLVGVVVNSGILFVEFADELIQKKLEAKEGLAAPGEKSCNGLTRSAFHECLSQAGKIRLLPIFLTVSTTIGGLIPLAFFGGPMWEGMAWLLIFGLVIATVLTLLVLPIIYAAFVEWFGVRLVRLPEES